MFTKPTVILTGAGASAHYGYPTGASLTDEMKRVAEYLRNFYDMMYNSGIDRTPDFFKRYPLEGRQSIVSKQYSAALDECNEMLKRLNAADPIVIDYFLGLNPSLEALGKLLIAWVILEHESNETENGNWIRHITHQLTVDCLESSDLLKNKISFITFNYDTTLERKLHNALQALERFTPKSPSEKLLSPMNRL